MHADIITQYHLSVDPADFDRFHDLVKAIVAEARKEADTLTYQYMVDEARCVVHIVEGYRMSGVLPHIDQTFAPYAETFLSLAKIEKLYVYGEPTPEIRAKLDGFGAIYLTQFEGFEI